MLSYILTNDIFDILRSRIWYSDSYWAFIDIHICFEITKCIFYSQFGANKTRLKIEIMWLWSVMLKLTFKFHSGKRTLPCSTCSIGILTYSIEQTSSVQWSAEFWLDSDVSISQDLSFALGSYFGNHVTCITVCWGILINGISSTLLFKRYPKIHLRMAWCATTNIPDEDLVSWHNNSNSSKNGIRRWQQSM